MVFERFRVLGGKKFLGGKGDCDGHKKNFEKKNIFLGQFKLF